MYRLPRLLRPRRRNLYLFLRRRLPRRPTLLSLNRLPRLLRPRRRNPFLLLRLPRRPTLLSLNRLPGLLRPRRLPRRPLLLISPYRLLLLPRTLLILGFLFLTVVINDFG